MKKKLKMVVILLIYVGVTVGLYALICYFIDRPFDELEFLYGVLVGCVAYLPRFIVVHESEKSRQ